MNLLPRSFFYDDDLDSLFFPNQYKGEMKSDVYEKDNDYYIELDIPGYDKEDINVEVQDDYLIVSVEKETESDIEEKNYIRRERSYGKYSRSFYLNNMDDEKIEAETKDGILYIKVPKLENSKKSKSIKIK